jgi:hypothetical protein
MGRGGNVLLGRICADVVLTKTVLSVQRFHFRSDKTPSAKYPKPIFLEALPFKGFFHFGLKLAENRGYSNVSLFFHVLAYSPNTFFSNG